MLNPEGTLRDDLWAPTSWRLAPVERVTGPPTAPEAAMIVLAVLWNVLSNEILPEWSYAAANVVAAAVFVMLGRRSGVTWDLMGLRPDRVGRGIAVGLLVAGGVVAAVTLLVAVAATRTYLADARFVGVTTGQMLYQVLVRIPLGTAVFEELVFRGVLLGVFLRRLPVIAAATASAVLFGLWHVLPTLDALNTNPAGDLVQGHVALGAAVIGTVAVLTVAGFGFTWLRLRAGSLVAPILAHAATNIAAYLAGWLVVTRGWA